MRAPLCHPSVTPLSGGIEAGPNGVESSASGAIDGIIHDDDDEVFFGTQFPIFLSKLTIEVPRPS